MVRVERVAVVTFSLFVCFSLAVAIEPRWWVVFRPEVDNFNYDHLTLSFDSRGSYKSFGLLVVKDAEFDKLAHIFPSATLIKLVPYASEQLWVVELSKISPDASEISQTIRELGVTPYSIQNNKGDIEAIVAVGDVSTLNGNVLGTTFVPVPTFPVRAAAEPTNNPAWRRFNATRTFAPDPLIQRLIATISEDNIRNSDVHLSNYNSRLSTSTTVLEAQAWLQRVYNSYGLTVSLYPFRSGYGSNVIAELKGSQDPSKIVVVGAHYDSRSTDINNANMRAPGADDNGSGTSAVLEMARAFADSGFRFKYTIRFASWCGEEQGLVGSRAYASNEAKEKANIIANINLDMIGYRRPNTGVSIALVTRQSTQWLTDAVEASTKTYLPGFEILYSTGCCSDQQSFVENGYPATSLFETPGATVVYPHYHRSTDLPEYLDFRQAYLITQAGAAAVATLAEPIS